MRVVALQPPWRVPHAFQRLTVDTPVAETRYAFTYGLAVAELYRAESLGDARLLDRVGLPWVIDLHNSLSEASPALSAALGELGIKKPNQESSHRWFPTDDGNAILAPSLIAELEGSATKRVREFLENELAPFASDLETAPGRPSPELLRLAQRFDAVYGQPARLQHFSGKAGPHKGSWGLRYESLHQRIASELLFLYHERPRLRRCVLCDAIFVARTNRANCTWTLWDGYTEEAIQRCSPPEAFEQYQNAEGERAHRRKRNALNEAVRRERKRAGGNEADPRFKRVLKAGEDYIREHGRRRGPTGHVDAPTIELRPATTDG